MRRVLVALEEASKVESLRQLNSIRGRAENL